MARSALGWSTRKLAQEAGVGVNTVNRLENNRKSLAETVRKIEGALEKAGVVFISENGGGAGVRLKK